VEEGRGDDFRFTLIVDLFYLVFISKVSIFEAVGVAPESFDEFDLNISYLAISHILVCATTTPSADLIESTVVAILGRIIFD